MLPTTTGSDWETDSCTVHDLTGHSPIQQRPVRPGLAEPREPSPLHSLGHLIMDQSYVCALTAMMVRGSGLGGPPGGPFMLLPSGRSGRRMVAHVSQSLVPCGQRRGCVLLGHKLHGKCVHVHTCVHTCVRLCTWSGWVPT